MTREDIRRIAGEVALTSVLSELEDMATDARRGNVRPEWLDSIDDCGFDLTLGERADVMDAMKDAITRIIDSITLAEQGIA